MSLFRSAHENCFTWSKELFKMDRDVWEIYQEAEKNQENPSLSKPPLILKINNFLQKDR